MEDVALRSDVDEFIARLRSGDSAAADRLFQGYAGRLAAVVRRRLGWRFCRKLDPEDVVQSVFRSFVRCQHDLEMHFENWDALWGLLSLIAMRKVGRVASHFAAGRRNLSLEHSVSLLSADSADFRAEAVSHEPDPQHLAMVAETITGLLEELDERDRAIVRLALEGRSTEQIAAEMGRSERTIQRVLRRLAVQLEEAAAPASSSPGKPR